MNTKRYKTGRLRKGEQCACLGGAGLCARSHARGRIVDSNDDLLEATDNGEKMFVFQEETTYLTGRTDR